MFKIRIVLFLLLFQFTFAFSQSELYNNSYRKNLINSQLSKTILKKIMALQKNEDRTEKLMQNSDKHYEVHSLLVQDIDAEKDKSKREELLKKSVKIELRAIRDRVEALKNYHDIYVQKYELYKTDLTKFYKSADNEIADSARALEKFAFDNFEAADFVVQKAYYTLNADELFKAHTKAFNLERLGVLFQEKAYALFNKWEKDIVERLDDEISSVQTNSPINSTEEKVVSEVQKDSVNIVTIVVYDTIMVQQPEERVVYQVQIAASKKPLNKLQLQAIYKNYDLINYEIDNGWYKYKLGYFNRYSDAQQFKTGLGIHDAFIVAYKEGKKTSLNKLINHSSFKK